jgi:hypothetical protein
MELTWIAVLASLLMAAAAACVFVFAVKKDYFRNIEDAKYQVFWSDLEDGPLPLAARPKVALPSVALPSAALPKVAAQEKRHEGGPAKSR